MAETIGTVKDSLKYTEKVLQAQFVVGHEQAARIEDLERKLSTAQARIAVLRYKLQQKKLDKLSASR